MALERRGSVLHPINTNLLLHVEVPVTGFSVLLNFEVRPGSLQQVQQGVTEVIDELGYRLANCLNEKDLQSSADKYEVAKLECEQQLQEWQAKLSEATLAVLRAERSRSELAKMREAYFREVQSLREQLHQKQQAEEQGEDFTPDLVDLFNTNKEDNEAGLLEQIDRMEEEHRAEIAHWKKRNADLIDKLKSKAMQATLQSELVAKVLDDTAAVHEDVAMTFCDAEVQTVKAKLKDGSCCTESVSQTSTSMQTLQVEEPQIERMEMEVQTDFEDSGPGKSSKTRSKGRSSSVGKQKVRTKSTELTAKDLISDLSSLEMHSPPDLAVDSAAQTHLDAAVLQAAGIPVATSTVATQVDPQQLTPVTPLSPRTPRTPQARRGQRPRQRAETVEDVAVDLLNSIDFQPEDSDSGISTCLLQTWPSEADSSARPVTAEGTKLPSLKIEERPDRSSKSQPSSARKKSALTVPTQEDVAGKEVLFTVSSVGHTAVMASYSDGARPSKRTINRPRLSSPSQYSTG